MIFLDDETQIKKFMEALSKKSLKHVIFILPSEDLVNSEFSNASNVMACLELMPPQYMIMECMHNGPNKKYRKMYLEYLHKVPVHELINKIVAFEVLMSEPVVVCNSRLEKDFLINRLLREVIEEIYGIRPLRWKDIKDNIPESLIPGKKLMKYYAEIAPTVTNIGVKLHNKMKESHLCDTPLDDI